MNDQNSRSTAMAAGAGFYAPSRTPLRFALLLAGWTLAFVLCATLPAQAQVTLARAPYLQLVSEHSATIVWRTSIAAACTLGYAPTGGTPTKVVTPAGTDHAVVLNGLSTATRYDYTIRCGSQLAGGADYYLRTAPSTGSPVRFLAWGDSGEPGTTQSAVAAMVNAQSVDLALLLGDILYPDGRPNYYDPRYYQVFAGLLRHTPTWAVLGNHDYPYLSTYLDNWYLPTNSLDHSERFYSFDYGDIHFVALDTNASFTTAVLNWLIADLDASTRRWKIVYFHHTIYSCGSAHGDNLTLINALTPVFDAHGVDLALNGHDHDFERTYPVRAKQVVSSSMNPDYVDPPGVIYVTSGATSNPRSVSTSCTRTARIFSTPSVARVTVDGDLLTLEAVGTSGQVLDRMTLRKTTNPPPPPPPQETLQITSPAGGETFTIGTVLPIQWTTSAGVGPVRIELSRNGTSGPWETLFPSTTNDGSETWTVTSPASSRCWLRVSEASDANPADLTDAAFVIATADPGGGPPVPPVSFNFQPATAAVPSSYIADTGQLFDLTRGYGWTAAVTMRERGVLASNPRDTFAEVTNSDPTVGWEYIVPNGYYRVSLLCGDATTTATHRVALEGQIVIRDEQTQPGQFIEREQIPVFVSDGRLSVTLGGSGDLTRTKLNALIITPSTPMRHVLLAPSGGESVCVGTTMNVQWSGATAGAFVRVEISRQGPGGPWEQVWMTADDGQEAIGAAAPIAEACLLRLVDSSGEVLAAETSPFTIAEASIELVTPNGGETWTAGTTAHFEWMSTCFTGDVRVDVSRSGPAGPWSILMPSTPNDGYERWVVRREDVGWTHVRILALPLELPNDQSDSPFAVVETPPPTTAVWRVDFLPAGAVTAYGYLPDAGQPYSSERGYGWNTTITMKQRNLLPGDCRDTFAQVANNTIATWEIDVPNGDYVVSLVCGDPLTSGTHRVALEGQLVIDDDYASGGNFVTRDEVPVSVHDGKLTMTVGGNGQITSTKVCCMAIEPAEQTGPGSPGNRWPVDRDAAAAGRALPDTDGLDLDGAPWHGPVSFTVQLALPAEVHLAVHDVRGRRVATLQAGTLPAGNHAFTWQVHDAAGTRLPSGVYFLRLDTPRQHLTRKLIVIR